MNKYYVKCVSDYKSINLDRLIQWMYDWWGQEEGWTKDKVHYYMKYSFNSNKMPKTIILFNEDNEEVGMCQITMHDLSSRPDIYPYLANLYIDVPYRKKGLLKLLLNAAIEEAKKMKISTLYLYTNHKSLYEKYGWTFVENVETFLNPHIQKLYKFNL